MANKFFFLVFSREIARKKIVCRFAVKKAKISTSVAAPFVCTSREIDEYAIINAYFSIKQQNKCMKKLYPNHNFYS